MSVPEELPAKNRRVPSENRFRASPEEDTHHTCVGKDNLLRFRVSAYAYWEGCQNGDL